MFCHDYKLLLFAGVCYSSCEDALEKNPDAQVLYKMQNQCVRRCYGTQRYVDVNGTSCAARCTNATKNVIVVLDYFCEERL